MCNFVTRCSLLSFEWHLICHHLPSIICKLSHFYLLSKCLDQMEPNFTRIFYERSFTKFAHFVLIWLKTWPIWTILFLIGWNIKKIIAWTNGTIFFRKVLSKFCSFCPNGKTWRLWTILVLDWLKYKKNLLLWNLLANWIYI